MSCRHGFTWCGAANGPEGGYPDTVYYGRCKEDIAREQSPEWQAYLNGPTPAGFRYLVRRELPGPPAIRNNMMEGAGLAVFCCDACADRAEGLRDD